MAVAAIAAGAAAWFAPAGPATAEPPAWQVTDSSGRQLWLLGSVHALRDSDHPLPAVIDALYERADVLVMELDLDDIDPVALQSALVAAAVLPEGTSLAEQIGDELYARTDAYARGVGFELRLLERFEPWFVSVTLLDLGMAARGFSAEGGVEQYLLRKAAADGKEVLGLETLERQIRVFDHLGPDEQALLLEQTLDELESDEDTLEALVAAWRTGELDELAGSLSAEFEGFPTLYTELVVRRNDAWITEIEQLLETQETELVVVGALHLVGEHNVIELLSARGLDVRPARPRAEPAATR